MKKPLVIIVSIVILAVLVGLSLSFFKKTPDESAGNVKSEVTVGEAVVDEASVSMLESWPLQATLNIKGNLPDGCTTIAGSEQDLQGFDIYVKVSTERPVDQVCTQALVPYEENIALDILGLPKGSYTVTVNGQSASFVLEQDNLVDFESDKGLSGN